MPSIKGDAKAVKTIEKYMSTNAASRNGWEPLKEMLTEHPFEILHRNDYSFRAISKLLGCSKGSISHVISPGQKEKTKTRKIKSKSAFDLQLKELKEKNGCQKCGKTFAYYALEFDHIYGVKIETVSTLKRKKGKLETLKEVNDKCQVLCIHCHRSETLIRSLKRNFIKYTTAHQNLKEESFLYVKNFLAGLPADEKINKRKMNLIYLKNLKESKACADCQEFFPYYLMDFDHTADDKVDNISKLSRKVNLKPLLEEIAKCELVCGHCHAKRSDSRRAKVYKKY